MSSALLRFMLAGNILFISVFWSLTSRGKNVSNFFYTFTHPRSIPIVLFEVFCFIQPLFLTKYAYSAGDLDWILKLTGVFIVAGATFLACWAKIAMGSNWGRPAQHDKEIQTDLVTNGPFSFSRNPIYIGLFLLFVGQQIALRSYFIILALPFYIVISKSVATEEALLTQFFGKKYTDYRKRVPRFIKMPF